jgi:cytochrome c556
MKPFIAGVFAISAVWASALAGQSVKVATIEDHDKAMKTISTNAFAVPKALEAGDLAEVKNRYVAMRAQFVGVEGFWADRKKDEPVALAKNAIAKIDAIIKAAETSDRPTIDAGIKELVAACAACHTKYREPDPTAPKSFVIKQGVL